MRQLMILGVALVVVAGLSVPDGDFGAITAQSATAFADSTSCGPNPTLTVDGSDTTLLAPGHTVTIRGTCYHPTAPLTLAISVGGGEAITVPVKIGRAHV